jgi:glucose/arabinose dehydrogenase
MRHSNRFSLPAIAAALVLASCGDNAHLPPTAGYGPHPTLPAPQESLLSYVHIAPAKSWEGEGAPTAAPGLTVTAFARGLDHPRWLMSCPTVTFWLLKPTPRPSPRTTKA